MTEGNYEKATKIIGLIRERKIDLEKLNHAIMLLGNYNPGFKIECKFSFPEASSHLLTWDVKPSNQNNVEAFLNLEATALKNELGELESHLAKL